MEKQELKQLARGIQSFEFMRHNDLLYIDKTEYIEKIVKDRGTKAVFLGRPRRFGKSLFLSTLGCYYEGKKELFEGLKIAETEKEWKKYEVLYLSFNSVASVEGVMSEINTFLCKYEEKYGISPLPMQSIKNRFQKIIQVAAKGEIGKVIVLIDEYDSPLASTMYDSTAFQEVGDVYRSFFPAFKEEDQYIMKVFITGIMKFTNLSLFSSFNIVNVISAKKDFAGICGFTYEEVDRNFKPYIMRLAGSKKLTYDQAREKLIERYDGYSFSPSMVKVFNPINLLTSLTECEFGSYWSATGTSKRLFDYIDNNNFTLPDWDNETLDAESINENDVNLDNLPLYLYQMGYLTIKRYDEENEVFSLGVPNEEIRTSLKKLVIPYIIGKEVKKSDNMYQRFRDYFKIGAFENAMDELKCIIADCPYSKNSEQKYLEERIQVIIMQLLYFSGFKVHAERVMIKGIIDIVCETDKFNVIIELKMLKNGGVVAAEQQIEEKGYVQPYLTDSMELYTIAVEFDEEKREMGEWKVGRVK